MDPLLLAQAVPLDPFAPYAELAKLGLGVASFAALLFFLRWLTGELKASRVEFLVALDKQHNDHAKEMHLLGERQALQTAGLHAAIDTSGARTREAIDDLGTEIRHFANGRSKT